MEKLAIIGSGDLAEHIIQLAMDVGQFEVVGVYDDFTTLGTQVGISQVIGKVDEVLPSYRNGGFDKLLIAVGYTRMEYRGAMFDRFKDEVAFATLIHGSCMINPTAEVGTGSVLFSGVIMEYKAQVGENIVVHSRSFIAHDAKLKNHSFLSADVVIAGYTVIEESCYLGISTTIIDNLTICKGTRTGGGTVVTKSIASPGLFVGVPARCIKSFE